MYLKHVTFIETSSCFQSLTIVNQDKSLGRMIKSTINPRFSFADSITKVPMYYFNLYKMIPQLRDLSRASFYTYKGSLTTPPCYQSVRWIVLENPVSTSREVVGLLYRQCCCYYLNTWLCFSTHNIMISKGSALFAVFSN